MNPQIQFPASWFDQKNPYRVLLVDPNQRLLNKMAGELGDVFKLERAGSGDTALQMLGLAPYHLLVMQLKLPLFSGIELAQRIKKILPEQSLIAVGETGDGTDDGDLKRLGFARALHLPDKMEDLVRRVRENLVGEEWAYRIDWLKGDLKRRFGGDSILSLTDSMVQVHDRIARVVNSRVPVMITGESGTGKELIARMIHATGDLGKRQFVVVNCAAVPEGLLESQFFGHEKGSFTGAVGRAQGKFELANGGTMFLDEIGEMSPSLQAKLLRVIEYGEFERVGGNETLKVDVRLITATNRNLETRVAEGHFRSDLLYRINVFPIQLPPLRERPGDVRLLAYFFLRNAGLRNNRQVRYIHTEALELLDKYPWPGNIREIENAVERAILLSDGTRLQREDFPQQLEWERLQGRNGQGLRRDTAQSRDAGQIPEPEMESILRDSEEPDPALTIRPLRDIERDAVIEALEQTSGNIALASRCLGISRNTLYRKIEEHGLEMPQAK